jgi:hypothetical protein
MGIFIDTTGMRCRRSNVPKKDEEKKGVSDSQK